VKDREYLPTGNGMDSLSKEETRIPRCKFPIAPLDRTFMLGKLYPAELATLLWRCRGFLVIRMAHVTLCSKALEWS
jgi:hypothetical protein